MYNLRDERMILVKQIIYKICANRRYVFTWSRLRIDLYVIVCALQRRFLLLIFVACYFLFLLMQYSFPHTLHRVSAMLVLESSIFKNLRTEDPPGTNIREGTIY